jgi:hypothetical protein
MRQSGAKVGQWQPVCLQLKRCTDTLQRHHVVQETIVHSRVVEMACEAECRVRNAAAKQVPCFCLCLIPVSACSIWQHGRLLRSTDYVVQLSQLACILPFDKSVTFLIDAKDDEAVSRGQRTAVGPACSASLSQRQPYPVYQMQQQLHCTMSTVSKSLNSCIAQ